VLEQFGYEIVIADLEKVGGEHSIQCNATDEADVKKTLDYCKDHFNGIDVVVNCQGIFSVARIENTSEEIFDKMVDVNLKSVFLVCKNAIPIMKWRKEGYIVNLASMAGLRGKKGEGAYCATKFGVVGLTEAIFEELRGTGVRISAVCPSSVDTSLLKNEVKLSRFELEKVLKPEDIARIVAELVTSNPRVLRKIVPVEVALVIDKLNRKERDF
jgi:NAD(P)-dependent dehydrogenase (short-subunit alcohol dehydrogenase family)